MSTALRGVGVKGSDVLSSTGDPRVDLAMRLVRGATAEDLQEGLARVLAMDDRAGGAKALEDAAVMTIHARAVRCGKGERDVAEALLMGLWDTRRIVAAALLRLWPDYGSWRDLFVMAAREGTPKDLRGAVLALTVEQLFKDAGAEAGDRISLCAKWAPREGQPLARELAELYFPDARVQHSTRMRLWRRLLAGLNRRLGTVETLMSAGRWAEIRPATVPGRAGRLYGRALLNLVARKGTALRRPADSDRMACRAHFQEHFAAAAAGRAVVHGADTVFPHELVKRAFTQLVEEGLEAAERDQLRAVWRGMVERLTAGGGLGRSIVMCDFSGSMQSAGAVGDLPYWVSMALGILGATVAAEPFRGRMMTFDSTPRWHRLPASGDLIECLESIMVSEGIGQGLSTNFAAAMELVLADLVQAGTPRGQEPENLIVLTDMGWDAATGRGTLYGKNAPWETHVDMIRSAFQQAGGWEPPRIVIWNLAARYAGEHHAAASVPGVAMLSGWSPAQFAVLQTEGPRQLTALEMLRAELDHPRYDPVRAAVAAAVGDHSDGWGAGVRSYA